MEKKLLALVLCAGKSTRLAADSGGVPKALRQVGGKAILTYILDNLSFIRRDDVTLVVGYKKEQLIAAFPDYSYAVQEPQLGTGHAVMCARSALEGFDGDVLVCYGDMPLLKRESYLALTGQHRQEGNCCTILSGVLDEAASLGRIVRYADGSFRTIVEARDSSDEENLIREYNSGVYVFDCKSLLSVLDKLSNDNAQSEYYLTDVPALMLEAGLKVGVCALRLGNELLGVNTPEDLMRVASLL